MEREIYRLWQPIAFDDNWKNCDTSIVDDIAASWFKRRKVLKENSAEYRDFLDRLKREHAIETGIIERLYSLETGITETFIKEGFVKSYLSHGDTNIPETDLFNHLNDHLDAVNFIFDIVKENRPLTIGFVKELHHLVTRHQKYAEGKDQFGNRLQIKLLKGTYKIRENNPVSSDEVVIMYCPPEHVAAEMDNLVRIFNEEVEKGVHSLILASWFHHAFTTIHPFQDGNGRVARLLASLIFIRYGYFPFTVLREEAKVKYIEALERADKGNPKMLVQYFGEVQKRNIQKALNIREITTTSLKEAQKLLSQKLEKSEENAEYEEKLHRNRSNIFDFSLKILKDLKENLEINLNGGTKINIKKSSFEKTEKQNKFYKQIVDYAKLNNYYFNRVLPKAWICYEIKLSKGRTYQMIVNFHHYGYDNITLALGVFLIYKDEKSDFETPLSFEIEPHVISIENQVKSKKDNIEQFLENSMTKILAQIANEIN